MERAFELGREALAYGEVPVGCVLYLPGNNIFIEFFGSILTNWRNFVIQVMELSERDVIE